MADHQMHLNGESSKMEISSNIPPKSKVKIARSNNKKMIPTKPRLDSTYFVLNTICLVPEYESDNDSDSEEMDGTFSAEDFEFEPSMFKGAGLYTTIPQITEKKIEIQTKLEEKQTKLHNKTTENFNAADDSIIEVFLKKLSHGGFVEADRALLKNIGVCFILNRMESLSSRKNNSVAKELVKKVKTNIEYKRDGLLWKCKWYRKGEKEPVSYKKVKKFYKQLKKLCPERARIFRETEEKNITVPYQQLRDCAKGHPFTKKLIEKFRSDDPEANIYLSLIDLDTVDFNGIYSAYLSIVRRYKTPTVMSTGYEFPLDDDDGQLFQFASKIDRKIRIETASILPLGAYYPEPNTCILIAKEKDCIPETFIDSTRPNGNLESACLMKNIFKERPDAKFYFIEDSPIITVIPVRARLNRVRKSKISAKCSREFLQGAPPTQADIKSVKQVLQCTYFEREWLNSLFINNAFAVKENDIKFALQGCIKRIGKINKCEEVATNEDDLKTLKEHIDPDVVDKIVMAVHRKNHYLDRFIKDCVRCERDDQFLKILNVNGIEIRTFSPDEFKMLAKLIENKAINIPVLRRIAKLKTKENNKKLSKETRVQRSIEKKRLLRKMKSRKRRNSEFDVQDLPELKSHFLAFEHIPN